METNNTHRAATETITNWIVEGSTINAPLPTLLAVYSCNVPRGRVAVMCKETGERGHIVIADVGLVYFEDLTGRASMPV